MNLSDTLLQREGCLLFSYVLSQQMQSEPELLFLCSPPYSSSAQQDLLCSTLFQTSVQLQGMSPFSLKLAACSHLWDLLMQIRLPVEIALSANIRLNNAMQHNVPDGAHEAAVKNV